MRVLNKVIFIIKNRLNKTGKIILLTHDRMFRNNLGKRRLRTFIRLLKANRWTLETIDSYSSSTPKTIVRNTTKSKTRVVSIPRKMLKASAIKKKTKKQRNPLDIFDIVQDNSKSSYKVA